MVFFNASAICECVLEQEEVILCDSDMQEQKTMEVLIASIVSLATIFFSTLGCYSDHLSRMTRRIELFNTRYANDIEVSQLESDKLQNLLKKRINLFQQWKKEEIRLRERTIPALIKDNLALTFRSQAQAERLKKMAKQQIQSICDDLRERYYKKIAKSISHQAHHLRQQTLPSNLQIKVSKREYLSYPLAKKLCEEEELQDIASELQRMDNIYQKGLADLQRKYPNLQQRRRSIIEQELDALHDKIKETQALEEPLPLNLELSVNS